MRPAGQIFDSDEREVEGERGAENLQGFGERSGRVVGQEWAKSGQQKGGFGSAIGKDSPRHVGDHEAGGEVEENLDDPDGGIVVFPEDGEHNREKSRISRQPHAGRGDPVVVGETVDSVVQPVIGDLSVHQGIVGDVGKGEEKEQTHGDGREEGEEKEAKVLPHQVAHALNITCQRGFSIPTVGG